MSTAAHPETDGQTERVNRVLEDVLRSYATSFASWSSFLSMAEFALNNSTHASTGLTPFFVNNARYPRVSALLAVRSSNSAAVSTLGVGGVAPTSKSVQESSEPPLLQSAKSRTRDATVEGHALYGVAYEEFFAVDAAPPAALVANFAPAAAPTPIDSAAVSEFLLHRQAVTRFVRDALQAAVDRQKANADRRGERVLLSTDGIQGTAVTNLGANKLAPRFIGPFKVLKVIGDAYTLDIPTAMRLHPTFYVGRLKPYVPATIPAPEAESPRPARNPSHPDVDVDAESTRALAPHARASPSVTRAGPSDERSTPASIEPQQSPLQQHIRAHTKRGSEPHSRRSSPDPSPACSSGAPSDVSIRSGEAPRQSLKRPKLPKPATLKSRGSEATPRPYETTFRRDVVKEYEATLALVSDDDSLDDDHDLVSFIAHEYPRYESLSNDDAIATAISDEAPANSRDVNSRGASSRDHSDDDYAARSVTIDVTTATSSATSSAARSAMLPSACTCIARA
ncbi:hypothetical protein PR002_g21389 [Phytophthora rubi]|uniref:Integrase catalytic domain-containing protein n=1 Tax=Phytophthora rubi TaxID=129364 RepID=A0A6A3J336_9STRA|nr:hypothetical protein PR002_g21389 [Phytophthora rubi]